MSEMALPIELLAALPVEGGAWGETAAPFQRRDAEAILDPAAPPFTWCGRPRGGRKTTDLAAIAVARHLTVAPPGARSYGVAADADQASLVIDSIRSFVHRAPTLKSRVKVETRRVVFLARGEAVSSLEVLPADEASSFGLRPWMVIADELSVWPTSARGLWAAVVSAMAKVDGSKLIVVTSAGDPAHWSNTIREHARTSTAWQLFEVAGPLEWISEEQLGEQRALLTTAQYDRLHLNLWTASEDRLVSVEGLAAAVQLAGPQDYRPGVTYKIGCDIGLRNDRTAIAVVHAEQVPDQQRRVVLDRMIVFEGTKTDEVSLAQVEETLFQTWSRYGHPRLRIDPWQAIGLAQRLRAKGVYVDEWSYSDKRYGAAASALFGLLRDGLLSLYEFPALLEELANVRLRETSLPGVVRVDHDPGRHDDMVQALGFAVTALLERPGGVAKFELAQGVVPTGPILRPQRSTSEPPVPIVREGEARPAEHYLRFDRARRHPRFEGPGRRW